MYDLINHNRTFSKKIEERSIEGIKVSPPPPPTPPPNPRK